jgi:hypothetical protein
MWMTSFATVLRDRMGDAASNVSNREIPNCLARTLALTNPMMKAIVPCSTST